MAILLSILLKADTDAAIAVYLVLRRSAPKYEALSAAANVTLSERDSELFSATLLAYQAAEAERNAFAHGIFGIHQKLRDSVLWVEMPNAAHFVVEMLRQEEIKGYRPPLEEHRILATKLRHYTSKALQEVHSQIRKAHTLVFRLNTYLRTSGDLNQHGRDLLYDQLCAEVPIQEALRALRENVSRSRRSTPLRRRARSRHTKGLTYKKPR